MAHILGSICFNSIIPHVPETCFSIHAFHVLNQSPLSTSPHLVDPSMARGKKHPLDKNNDKYKSANAWFNNPFRKKIKYTMMSTSATSSKVNTVHKSRMISYYPPSVPPLVEKNTESILKEHTPPEPTQKTQARTS